MERENRYLVIKRSDLEATKSKVTAAEFETFCHVCEMVEATRNIGLKKSPLCCVVVEHDWPEYEPTWKAIEKRVDERTAEQNSQRGH